MAPNIIWTNAGILLLIRILGTNFIEIFIKIHIFSFKKMHLKMSSGKCRPSYLVSRKMYFCVCSGKTKQNKQGKSEGFDSCDPPSNLKLDSNRQIFRPCDREIWWMTSKNNRTPLLCYCKLCASFRTHWWIQTGVTVRKRPIWVKFDDF